MSALVSACLQWAHTIRLIVHGQCVYAAANLLARMGSGRDAEHSFDAPDRLGLLRLYARVSNSLVGLCSSPPSAALPAKSGQHGPPSRSENLRVAHYGSLQPPLLCTIAHPIHKIPLDPHPVHSPETSPSFPFISYAKREIRAPSLPPCIRTTWLPPMTSVLVFLVPVMRW